MIRTKADEYGRYIEIGLCRSKSEPEPLVCVSVAQNTSPDKIRIETKSYLSIPDFLNWVEELREMAENIDKCKQPFETLKKLSAT